MTFPTRRGAALLAVALLTYVAARVLGTWELYLMALAFAVMTGVAWVLVLAGSRRLSVDRQVTPPAPVAGDPLGFTFTVETGRRLPGLRILIEGATGGAPGLPDAVVVDDAALGPRRRVAAGPRPARRGVHILPAYTTVVEDPLGLARARRTCGEPLRLTVTPRLVQLAVCPLCNDDGRARGGGRRRRPARDAWELRSIRPHLPGEPLSRVDWKSTAKTGALMLREMETDTDDDVTVLLDGRRPRAVEPDAGSADRPDEVFETAVVAAGSVTAFALGSGHAASLVLPDGGWREVRLAPDAAGRRRLPAALAEVRPQSPSRLGSSLPAVLGGRKRDRRRPLVLVTSQLDDDLATALVGLRREAVPVSVVHVLASGLERRDATRDPRDLTAADTLRAADVRYVTLTAGGDVRAALQSDAGRPSAAVRRAPAAWAARPRTDVR